MPDTELSTKEVCHAGRLAHYLLRRHGYWMALYHCTTMMIWCRKYKPRWSEEDSANIYYWREVRNIAFKNIYRS